MERPAQLVSNYQDISKKIKAVQRRRLVSSSEPVDSLRSLDPGWCRPPMARVLFVRALLYHQRLYRFLRLLQPRGFKREAATEDIIDMSTPVSSL